MFMVDEGDLKMAIVSVGLRRFYVLWLCLCEWIQTHCVTNSVG